MSAFGARLKQIRQQKKWSQKDLSKRIGVSNVSISGYESGNRYPDTDTLSKLADVLEVSTDYLLGRDVPKWASTKDVTDLERVLKLNDDLEYRGEKLSNEDRQQLLRVIEAIFWEQKEEKRDQP
ncbi:helix-turn-helix domain-containing protein [Alkalibacterium sp. f15]|uniref:helix-turn-helix domain-containing protein n=1 Tax=Alkalibacterium sp. f15 TaxID=3414029 RepID=UPI003BF83F3E